MSVVFYRSPWHFSVPVLHPHGHRMFLRGHREHTLIRLDEHRALTVISKLPGHTGPRMGVPLVFEHFMTLTYQAYGAALGLEPEGLVVLDHIVEGAGGDAPTYTPVQAHWNPAARSFENARWGDPLPDGDPYVRIFLAAGSHADSP